jgi:hypothetical protein
MLLKKIARVILLTLLILLVTGIALLFLFKNRINAKVGKLLVEKIETATSGKYALSAAAPAIGLLDGSARFHDVTFIPTEKADTSDALYSVVVENIVISGISFRQLLLHNRLIAGRLEADHLLVIIRQAKHRRDKDSLQKDSARRPGISSIAFRDVRLQNVAIKVMANNRDELFYSEHGDVAMNGFLIDSTLKNTGQLFKADSFRLMMGTFSYTMKNDLYTLRGKNVRSSYTDAFLQVDSVELVPSYSKADFAKEAGQQISRLNLFAKGAGLRNFDVKAFLEWNLLVADKLKITGLSASIYRDMNIPLAKISRPSLQKIISEFPFRMSIDTAELLNGRISYEELAEGREKTAKVFVSGMDGLITGLSTEETGKKKKHIQFSSKGLLFGKGKMYLYCDFPMNDLSEHFLCTGFVEQMDAQLFNAYTEHALNLMITEGKLDSMTFSFSANHVASDGKLKTEYHGLKVALPGEQNLKAVLLKGLANGLIRDNNPDNRGKEIEGTIHFVRNPYRYFPYYIFRSIMSGLPSSLGVPVTVAHDQ